MFLQGLTLDQTKKHDVVDSDGNYLFEPTGGIDGNCPHVASDGGDTDKQCCGVYPLRAPHKTSSTKSCCGTHMLDSSVADRACCYRSDHGYTAEDDVNASLYDDSTKQCCADSGQIKDLSKSCT